MFYMHVRNRVNIELLYNCLLLRNDWCFSLLCPKIVAFFLVFVSCNPISDSSHFIRNATKLNRRNNLIKQI